MTTSSEKKTFALLSEIFSLIAKYGEENFHNAISKLNDPELVNALNKVKSSSAIINKSIKTSDKITNRAVKSPDEIFKTNLVKSIKSHLSNTKLFNTSQDVREYLERQKFVNPTLINKKSRQQMINTFCKQCDFLSIESLESILSELKNQPLHTSFHKDDRSLENWSDIILKKDNKKDET
ncbi:hypothetical protein [Citrobacter europaeus]|uniref:hypothetical protein n=1 Tax=Citrobacter europaeus TaxID=1914243 RepID=UPI00397E093B